VSEQKSLPNFAQIAKVAKSFFKSTSYIT